jgi:RNA polymerase sigma-70 factor (ECF subfamily)
MERRTGRNAGAPADTSPESERPADTAAPSGRLLETGRETSLRERLVARDERALAELVEVATPWLLNLARAMLQDEDEAEEVVTEAFRRLWQNIPSAAGEHAGLIPYLMRITRHRAIDRLRARRRRQRLLSAAALAGEPPVIPPSEPDEAGRPGYRVHAQVHAALKELPSDEQAVVQLAYFRGLSQSEVAAELGIPLGTVKSRLRRAFGRLRQSLAGLEGWVV